MFSLIPKFDLQQTLEPQSFSSIFLKTEKKLDSSHIQDCLKYIARRKNMARYHSIVDFLFCELYTEYQKGCFRFYAGQGPPLRKILKKNQIRFFDQQLVKALNFAIEFEKQNWVDSRTNKKINWRLFLERFKAA